MNSTNSRPRDRSRVPVPPRVPSAGVGEEPRRWPHVSSPGVCASMEEGPSEQPLHSGLLARAAAGDEVAFEALYRRYAPVVLGRLRRILGRDGEDSFQETFLSVLRHLKHLRDAERFERWLLRIARNAAYGHLRERRAAAPFPARPPDLTPDRKAEQEEEKGVLRQCLARLPGPQQAALILYHVEGLKHREIAARLGRKEAAVSQLISRGRRLLRKYMERKLGRIHTLFR